MFYKIKIKITVKNIYYLPTVPYPRHFFGKETKDIFRSGVENKSKPKSYG